MDETEKDFWIALGLWGAAFLTVFGTGLFGLLVEDRYVSGGIVTAVGLIGVGYMTLHLKGRRLTRTHAVIGVLVLNWLFLGYDIYSRYRWYPPKERLTADSWENAKLVNVYNELYRDETVEVDGKRFIGCTFDNVTFVYKGTASFEFNPWPPKVSGHFIIRAPADAPAVAKTLDLCTASEFNAGCAETTYNHPSVR